jgi:hypothetical protein
MRYKTTDEVHVVAEAIQLGYDYRAFRLSCFSNHRGDARGVYNTVTRTGALPERPGISYDRVPPGRQKKFNGCDAVHAGSRLSCDTTPPFIRSALRPDSQWRVPCLGVLQEPKAGRRRPSSAGSPDCARTLGAGARCPACREPTALSAGGSRCQTARHADSQVSPSRCAAVRGAMSNPVVMRT